MTNIDTQPQCPKGEDLKKPPTISKEKIDKIEKDLYRRREKKEDKGWS